MSEKIVSGMKAVDFTYRTAFKEGIVLSEKAKEADKTFLIFLRYMGCTSCQVDIMDYSEEYARFKEKNAQIVLVLQSKPEIMRAQTTEENPPFDIVCDPEMELYKIYDVKAAGSKEEMINREDPVAMAKLGKKREKAAAHGFTHGEYEGDEMQLPALFLLDKELNVLHDHRAAGLTDMPSVDEMLELL